MKLSKIGSFEKELKLRIPSGASHYEAKLTPQYKILSKPQAEEVKKKIEAEHDTDGERENAFIRAIVLGVKGLEDEDGKQVEPEKARDILLAEYPFIGSAILELYNESLGSTRVKN